MDHGDRRGLRRWRKPSSRMRASRCSMRRCRSMRCRRTRPSSSASRATSTTTGNLAGATVQILGDQAQTAMTLDDGNFSFDVIDGSRVVMLASAPNLYSMIRGITATSTASPARLLSARPARRGRRDEPRSDVRSREGDRRDRLSQRGDRRVRRDPHERRPDLTPATSGSCTTTAATPVSARGHGDRRRWLHPPARWPRPGSVSFAPVGSLRRGDHAVQDRRREPVAADRRTW